VIRSAHQSDIDGTSEGGCGTRRRFEFVGLPLSELERALLPSAVGRLQKTPDEWSGVDGTLWVHCEDMQQLKSPDERFAGHSKLNSVVVDLNG